MERRWQWRSCLNSTLVMLTLALLVCDHVVCQEDDGINEELKQKYPNLHRRGLLPKVLAGRNSKRLQANQAGVAKVNDGGPRPVGNVEAGRRPLMPPEQPKVRYDVNPWQDTQKYSYKWPENQRAYFTCPRGYFIAFVEPRFGGVQSSVLRVPWNTKTSMFTLKDKYDQGLSPTGLSRKYPKMNMPKLSKDEVKKKEYEEAVVDPNPMSRLSRTGCDPVLQCLGHQACLFKISVELCAADPVPGNRKMFFISVTCAKDSMEGDYITESKDFAVARRERDQTLYLVYDAAESTDTEAHIAFHQMPEDEIFGVDCPPVKEAIQNGSVKLHQFCKILVTFLIDSLFVDCLPGYGSY